MPGDSHSHDFSLNQPPPFFWPTSSEKRDQFSGATMDFYLANSSATFEIYERYKSTPTAKTIRSLASVMRVAIGSMLIRGGGGG